MKAARPRTPARAPPERAALPAPAVGTDAGVVVGTTLTVPTDLVGAAAVLLE